MSRAAETSASAAPNPSATAAPLISLNVAPAASSTRYSGLRRGLSAGLIVSEAATSYISCR
jgi:hypothetical protein